MEYLDIVDEHGVPTGESQERSRVHASGLRHRTAHVWLVRERDERLEILLQKRSGDKDSFPGCYDKSSAGHIPAGVDYIPSALRELKEELGCDAEPWQLLYCGMRHIRWEKEFRGEFFKDNQVSRVYALWLDKDAEDFSLQEEEVSEVRWFDFEDCVKKVGENLIPNCIDVEELMMVKNRVEEEKRVDGIIFDVDGTLWDITPVCADAWTDAVRRHSDSDIRITAEQLKNLFGKPMDVIFAAIFPEMPEQERMLLSEYCVEYEHAYIARSDTPPVYAGVKDTMKKLAEKLPLFIVSNCQKGYIELFLEKTGMGAYITDFLCFGDTGLPKSGTMRRLIEKNHLQAPVYVGDTCGDEEACGEAEVPFVYAAYGFGTAKAPHRTIEHFSELSQIIK